MGMGHAKAVTANSLKSIEIATIDAIVCVFESERPGDYGAIAASATDRGGLSYGKHQAALVPGTLFKLVNDYCAVVDAGYAAALRPYLDAMNARDRQLDSNGTLHGVLRAAAKDPVMQRVQDDFFAREYMGPALAKWAEFGFRLPLSAAVIYDSYIQSGEKGFANLAAKVDATVGKATPEIERGWIEAYVAERRKFLEGSSSKDVRNSVVRMATWEALINSDNWSLALPVRVQRPGGASYPLTPWDLSDHLFEPVDLLRRGGSAGFGVAKQGDASGPNGRDRFVQTGLVSLALLTGAPDGRFGKGTATAVKAFQKRFGLSETGVVDAKDFDQLCDQVEILQTKARSGQGSDGLVKIEPAKKTTQKISYGGAGAAVAGGSAVVAATTGAGDQETVSPATPAVASPAPAADATMSAPAELASPSASPSVSPSSAPSAAPSASVVASTPAPTKAPAPTNAEVSTPRTYDVPVIGKVPSWEIAVVLAVAVVASVVLVSLGLRKSY